MAADTYSSLLGLLEQGTGNNNNSWGTNLNTGALDKVDLAIAGSLSSAVTGGTLDLSGTPPPAGPSGVIHSTLFFSGVLTSNQIVIVPNLQKWWMVSNATSGAFTLSMKTPSGGTVVIPQWSSSGLQQVYCTGSDVILVAPFNWNQIRMPNGTAALPVYSNVNETNSGWYRNGTQDWRLSINGIDVLQVTGAGASTASIFNILSPNALQLAGTPIRLPGEEMDYSGLTEPPGWYFTAGQAKNRVTDATLFAVIAPNTISGVAITGNTHTSTTLDNLTVDMRALGLVGAWIEGTGIQTGTTIVSIAASSLVLSATATGTATGIAIRVLPFGQGDASTTFNLPDRRGMFVAIRDDMNGTARGLLSKSTPQGIDGTRLNATGGEQGHSIIITELAAHFHANTLSDPGHVHNLGEGNTPVGGTSSAVVAATAANGGVTASAVLANTTGIVINNAIIGSDAPHNNIPPASIANRLIKR